MVGAHISWGRLLAVGSVYLSAHTVAAVTVTRSTDLSTLVFDYVVVGSGPGGSVMASRLSENPDVTVAIIEAGTFTEDTVGNLSSVPGYDIFYDLVDPAAPSEPDDWGFITTPQAGVDGLRQHYTRGKCLGGSSSLNTMAWLDNPAGAWQKWADEVGDQSWEFSTVTKYFAKAIHFTSPADTRRANATPDYDPAEASYDGPLSVTFPAYGYSWTTWAAAGLKAIGIPHVDTFINSGRPLLGSAWAVSTVNHTNGNRASADRAYLRPVLDRPNLYLFDNTLAQRVLFDEDAKATSVVATQRHSTGNITLHATREIILSAGAFQSPQLLMVSGIGPRADLEKYDIPVVADRPGVGQNMQDQYFFGLGYRVNLEPTLVVGNEPGAAQAVNMFNMHADGPLTSPGGEYNGYEKIPKRLRSGFSPQTEAILATYPDDWPEAGYLADPFVFGNGRNFTQPTDGGAYGSIFGLLQTPTSRGTVGISSASMDDPPIINPNWLTTQEDLEVGIAMFKRIQELGDAITKPANGSSDDTGVIINRVFPALDVPLDTDEQIGDWLRGNIITIYHASATNKMGKSDDPMAVVDSKGRVFGASNLRVCDISAFPFLGPGTAPQGTLYAVAEKLADDVKAAQQAESFWQEDAVGQHRAVE